MKLTKCWSLDSRRTLNASYKPFENSVEKTFRFAFFQQRFLLGLEMLHQNTWKETLCMLISLKTFRTKLQKKFSILRSIVLSTIGCRLFKTFWSAMEETVRPLSSLKQRWMPTLFCSPTKLSKTLKWCMVTLHKISVRSLWKDSRKENSKFLLLLMLLPED